MIELLLIRIFEVNMLIKKIRNQSLFPLSSPFLSIDLFSVVLIFAG